MTDENRDVHSLEEVLQAIAEAKNEWFANNDKETIRKQVHAMLDKQSKRVLLLLLGFEFDSWGRETLKVDHCNRRDEHSQLGMLIEKWLTPAAHEWIQINLESPPKITEKEKQRLRQIYREEFWERLVRYVRSAAEKQADEALERIVKEETNIEQLVKLLREWEERVVKGQSRG